MSTCCDTPRLQLSPHVDRWRRPACHICLTPQYNLPGVISDAPLAATRDGEGRWLGGSPAQWAEELTGAVLEHGAAGFVYFPVDDSPAVERWAKEVVPAVREAL